jgi:arylsulfatase A-like enzyme
MGLYGYERETAPRFTELAKRSTVWENAFTACPDTYSTTVSLFTGLQPLAHRNTGTDAVPLPEETPYLPALMAEAGYATVAFTEGEGPDGKDLVYESGLARGFEHFNPAFPQVPLSSSAPGPMVPKGARETLQRAAEWIQEHRELERYFVFIRLRELRKPYSLARYETPPWENFSRGIDVYDAAVLDVDKQIGLFVERLKEMGSLEDTCLLITSPYGLDFSEPERAAWRRGAKGVPRLTEESARVPLLLSMPEGVGRTRRGLVSLTTMGPTLASLAGVRLSKGSTEASLLEYTPSEDPVTVYGDPVALSVRTMEWRLNWNSGLKAADLSPVAPGHILGLYSLAEYKEKKWAVDMQGREPELSRRLAAQLEAYTSRVTTTGDAPR